jgi:hypothetical protein
MVAAAEGAAAHGMAAVGVMMMTSKHLDITPI